MAENNNKARRKLLKSIAAGGGAVVVGKSLPESWSRPVVDGVMLPAHAATSMMNSSGTATQTGRVGHFNQDGQSLLSEVADTLIPEANARILNVKGLAQTCVEHVQEGGGGIDKANFQGMVVYGDVNCAYSVMFTARDVPVTGVSVPLAQQFLCRKPVDNDGLLDRFGLIQNANAGEVMMSAAVVINTLTGVNGGASGMFTDGTFTFNFDLPREVCDGFIPDCNCEDEA